MRIDWTPLRAELAELGLKVIYVGAESGDEDVLRQVDKGENYATTASAPTSVSAAKGKSEPGLLAKSAIAGVWSIDG